MCPGIDDLIVTLFVGNETHIVVAGDALYFVVTTLHEGCLLLRDDDISEVERQTAVVSELITKVLDTVKESASTSHTDSLDDIGDKAAKSLLGDDIVEETYLYRDDLIYDNTTYRSLDHTLADKAVVEFVLNNNLHGSVYVYATLIVSNDSFLGTIESEA